MTPNTRRYLFDALGIYRIRIQGRLGTHGAAGFTRMLDCTLQVRQESPTITTLTGTLLDQTGPISVLTQLYDLGYPLLDVRRLPDKADVAEVYQVSDAVVEEVATAAEAAPATAVDPAAPADSAAPATEDAAAETGLSPNN